MGRQIKKLTFALLAFTLILAPASLANEKKPAKENQGIGSGGAKSPANQAEKVQEPVVAPTPTSQPIEVTNKSSGAQVSKNETVASPTPAGESTSPKPETAKPETAKPEPANSESPKSQTAKPETAKPEPAKVESPKPEPSPQESKRVLETSATATSIEKTPAAASDRNTAALTREVVVNSSVFKNQRLVAGKVPPGQANAAAKDLIVEEADKKCGAPEKLVNAKASKKVTVKETTEECKNFILVFTGDSTRVEIEAAASSAGGKVLRSFNSVFKGALVNGPASKILALTKNPKVQLIEVDGTVSVQAVYSNPVWGLDRSDQRELPLNGTYDDLDNGANTIPIYVVDTGIYADHSEFSGRVAPGATSIVDGYGTWDCNGHGTHVAGTIGGTNYGIAKFATLIPIRVLDCSGFGSYSGVIAGLDWIAANHPTGVPGVVNMSLGGSASSSLDSAVNNLISRGLNVVVAAGNSGADACNYSPARVPSAITVAATSSNDSRANYSNFGTCVDLFAPGSLITSAWINGVTGSAVASGTSMAAPHVAGAIARYLYTNPSSTTYQTANSLTKSATVDLVSNVGAGTPNRLLFIDIAFDGTTEPATSTKPANSKKTTSTGKGKKP